MIHIVVALQHVEHHRLHATVPESLSEPVLPQIVPEPVLSCLVMPAMILMN